MLSSYAEALSHFTGKRKRVAIGDSITLRREPLPKARGEEQLWSDIQVYTRNTKFATILKDDTAIIHTKSAHRLPAKQLRAAFHLEKLSVKNVTYLVPYPRFGWRDRHSITGRARWPHIDYKADMIYSLHSHQFLHETYDRQFDIDPVGQRAWNSMITKMGKQMRLWAKLDLFTAECKRLKLEIASQRERDAADAIAKVGGPVNPWSVENTYKLHGTPAYEQFIKAVTACDPMAMLQLLARNELYSPLQYPKAVTAERLLRGYETYYARHRSAIRELAGALKERTDDGADTAVPAEADGADAVCAA